MIKNYINCWNLFLNNLRKKDELKEIRDFRLESIFSDLKNRIKINKLKRKYIIDNKMSERCKFILKSGKNIGSRCTSKSIENGCCKRHLKCNSNETKGNLNIGSVNSRLEKDTGTVSDIDSEEKLIIRKNKFNNFVFGNTKLIIKSANEKYVVAKEDENGNWKTLTEEDIKVCKKYHLRYRIIDFSFKGEKSNMEIIKKIDLFDTKNYIEPMIKLDKYDFMSTNDMLEDD